MNEAETRADHIDHALAAAGWGVVEGSRIRREYPIAPGRLEGYGRRGKSLSADYVLEYRNTKLAVVEAKAWDEALTEGVAQAKNYAGKLAIRFTYSTNGQGIYGIDMDEGTEGDVPRYPTPNELWNLTFAEPVYIYSLKDGINDGELNQDKLSPLLKLKYNNAIADAVADLGQPERIKDTFSGFQKYLYQGAV